VIFEGLFKVLFIYSGIEGLFRTDLEKWRYFLRGCIRLWGPKIRIMLVMVSKNRAEKYIRPEM